MFIFIFYLSKKLVAINILKLDYIQIYLNLLNLLYNNKKASKYKVELLYKMFVLI